jgi:hypothetical protein
LRYCRSRFSHLYFSCKNYQELAQARITKVVGYFTTNPTKLVSQISDFSTIFYAIYKNQPNHKYYLSYPFAVRPLERSFLLQCDPWARAAAVRRQIWPGIARVRPGKGRGGLRGSLGFGLWPRMGGKSLVSNRPAASRRPGRGAPLSGGAPAWERGAVVLGRLGRP